MKGKPGQSDHYFGRGVHGNGNYCTSSATMEESITEYAGAFPLGGEGWVFQLKIRKEARIVTKDALKELPGPPRGLGDGDLGFKAQWHGYDVIHVEHRDYYVILNKRAVVVNEKSLPGNKEIEAIRDRGRKEVYSDPEYAKERELWEESERALKREEQLLDKAEEADIEKHEDRVRKLRDKAAKARYMLIDKFRRNSGMIKEMMQYFHELEGAKND